MTAKYDLVVIGAGPAGEKGAAQAAYFGKRVAIVDSRPRPGGIAVTSAGIPTKTSTRGSHLPLRAGPARERRSGCERADPWGVLMARRLEVSEFMTKAVERNLVRHGIESVRGRARLLPGPKVEVEKAGGERVDARGRRRPSRLWLESRPPRPASLTTIPTCTTPRASSRSSECRGRFSSSAAVRRVASTHRSSPASAYRSRSWTAAITSCAALDVEMARVLAESFNAMGIRVIPDASASAVAREHGALEVRLADGRKLRAEKVLVAVGRRPQTEGLGLAEAGVELDDAGWVRVDDRYATTAPGVFAAGDVIGPLGLASDAMEQARVAVCRAFGFEFKTAADSFGRRTCSRSPRPPGSASRRSRRASSANRVRGGPVFLRHECQGPDLRVSGRPREARLSRV